jgi:hypothetical protein
MRISVKSIFQILTLSLSFAFFACASGQTTTGTGTTPPTTPTNGKDRGAAAAAGRGFTMDQANQALGNLTYSPYGRGWSYKNTDLPAADFNSWTSKFKGQIQQAVDAVGTGFVLQVTGHTCSIGPREATDGKKGNIWYSTERAKGVYDSLVKAGVSSASMTFTGVADDESLPGIDTKNQKNRRVTFKIVPKN